jgi:hypothetical protein
MGGYERIIKQKQVWYKQTTGERNKTRNGKGDRKTMSFHCKIWKIIFHSTPWVRLFISTKLVQCGGMSYVKSYMNCKAFIEVGLWSKHKGDRDKVALGTCLNFS